MRRRHARTSSHISCPHARLAFPTPQYRSHRCNSTSKLVGCLSAGVENREFVIALAEGLCDFRENHNPCRGEGGLLQFLTALCHCLTTKANHVNPQNTSLATDTNRLGLAIFNGQPRHAFRELRYGSVSGRHVGSEGLIGRLRKTSGPLVTVDV
jgi:hypothetical protein